MSDLNKTKRPISAYQQLTCLLNAVKTDEITLNDAMNQIQLKDTKPTRPYCKVTSGGALALYGVTKQPIVLYADQWNKLSKVIRSDYLQNYMKYNETRLKYKPRKNNTKSYDDIPDGFENMDNV
jgi:hypothetical protein